MIISRRVAYVLLVLLCLGFIPENEARAQVKTNTNRPFVIDGHSHIGLTVKDSLVLTDGVDFLKARGLNSIFFALPVDRSKTENLALRIENEINQIEKLKEINTKTEVRQIEKAHELGKLSLIYSVEYFGGFLHNDLDQLDKIADLGVKYICLINNSEDRLFENNNLTFFGKQVIERCNDLGLTIDLTHLGESEMLSVLDYSTKPVIASHSCIKALTDLPYNLSDRVIQRIADKGGIILVSFNQRGLFLDSSESQNGVNQFCAHLDYLKQMVGIKYIGIGTDQQAMGKYVPEELNKDDSIKRIQERLITMGYSDDDIKLLMHGNLIRFFNLNTKD